jgi:hypothetical protein
MKKARNAVAYLAFLDISSRLRDRAGAELEQLRWGRKKKQPFHGEGLLRSAF